MGHVAVGHRWDRVAMDLLDLSVTSAKGNRYVLVMADCFSRRTEACPLPDKTALSVADAICQHVVCRFGMPSVIHSDQGREFENKVMQELCLLCGAHKTRTTPYHPESDGLVERLNRTLLMMLAMFVGENKDDWDDLLPAVMMGHRSSVHESTGLVRICSCLAKNAHCRWISACHDGIRNRRIRFLAHMPSGFGMRWRWRLIRFVDIRARQFNARRGYMIKGRSDAYLLLVTG